MSDEQRQIDRPDKPFHKAECVCAACEDWRAANPLSATPNRDASQLPSRSMQKRLAIQRGEPMPTFSNHSLIPDKQPAATKDGSQELGSDVSLERPSQSTQDAPPAAPYPPPAELGRELPDEPGFWQRPVAMEVSAVVWRDRNGTLYFVGESNGVDISRRGVDYLPRGGWLKATVPLSSGERMCSCCGLCVKAAGGVLSDGVICQIDCLPKSALSSGEHRLMPPSSHAYGMCGSCECANCTQLRINELTAEVTRLKAELEAARRLIAAESAWESTNAND